MPRAVPRHLFLRKEDLMNKQPSPEKIQRINNRLSGILSMSSVQTDPQGMYTGVPADPNEKPVQDADDL